MSSILPTRSRAGYKQVDSDDNDRATTGGKRMRRFGWKKFALGAVVIIGIVWVFGPRERRENVLGSIKRPSWEWPTAGNAPHHGPGQPSHTALQPTTTPKPPPAKTLPSSPHSPQDDPDRLKTVHCLTPHKDGARLVQYALMIDAGSTGSRIHIYKFNNCGASPAYEYEVFKQTQPGLSYYKGKALEAAQSLDILLDEAVSVVPRELQACTPVAVKATAGLRLLPGEQSEDILKAIRKRLAERYPFAVVQKDGVVIMDGRDEGVYAWITANYLFNTIRSDSPSSTPPYAVLDLGGASTQIVFEPSFNKAKDSKMEEGDHKYELVFGGKTHTLYQHSYLGYGLMRARKNVHKLVEFMAGFNRKPVTAPQGGVEGPPIVEEIVNPCLARGTTRVVEIEPTRPGDVARNVTMVGKDVGAFEACNRVIELVMAKDSICHTKPCSFDGVYQPSILDTFPEGKILLLSYFYDRLAPFFAQEQHVPTLTVASLADLAKDVCLGPSRWVQSWKDDDALMRELQDRPEWCLDLTFMHALLTLGYEFGQNREVTVEKKVDGTELGWCLGATIAIVGGELTCRI